MTRQFTLGKNERLKSRKQIEQLFQEGKKISVPPFYLYYLVNKNSDSNFPGIQFGVAVSGKNFKKAVDRNRIKRLTREAYRLQKIPLQQKLEEKNLQLQIFFIYTGKELPDFNTVKEKVAVALKKLLSELLMKTFLQILSFPFIALIKLYQWIISPWIGPKCRFTPTCSHYAAEAFKKYGVFKGLWLS